MFGKLNENLMLKLISLAFAVVHELTGFAAA